MAFKKITESVENISNLSDTPSLTPGELKKVFDKGNKIIKESFNHLIDELNNNMFPIGTGFIAYDDTDYTNHLGFRWERCLIGKVAVGKSVDDEEFNTVGKTGGEKTHKLVGAEIPKHSLNVNGYSGTGGSTWHFVPTTTDSSNCSETPNTMKWMGKTSEYGGDIPHNNLQPYEVVNYWKRVA